MSVAINRINISFVVNKLKAAFPTDYARLVDEVREELSNLAIPERYVRDSSEELICELIRFLYIKKHNTDVSPPYLIDRAWHAVLLMPKFYCTICGFIARDGADGVSKMEHIIDHDPQGGTGSDARPRQTRYERTLQKCREFFPNSSSVTMSVIWNEDLFNNLVAVGHVPAAVAVASMNAAPVVEEDNRVPDDIQIFIRQLTGRLVAFRVNKRLTISELKDIVSDREGIPRDDQRLIFAGRQLEDDQNLENCGIVNESTLHLVRRLRGC